MSIPNGLVLTRIADLRPGMKKINAQFIVLERGLVNKTKEGSVITQHLVADASGSIMTSFWDEKGDALQPGDIFIVKGGRYGTILRTGEYVSSSILDPLQLSRVTCILNEDN